jgi:hypothetical protein
MGPIYTLFLAFGLAVILRSHTLVAEAVELVIEKMWDDEDGARQ